MAKDRETEYIHCQFLMETKRYNKWNGNQNNRNGEQKQKNKKKKTVVNCRQQFVMLNVLIAYHEL